MEVTVNMTAEEFLEFVAWGKDRDYYKSRLDKELNKREILAKKTCWAIDADPKKPGKVKIIDQATRRNCWKWPRITWHKKKSHLRPVLSTRRRWQYRRRKTVRYTYIISGSRTEYKPEKATGPRPRIAPVRVISKVTSSRKGGTHGLRS